MLPRKFLLIAVLLLVIGLPVTVLTWQALAQENALLFDTPVDATISAGETQRWHFDAYNEDVITITVTRNSGDLIPELRILNEDGTLYAQTQGNGAATQLSLRLGQRDGYVLEIEALNATAGEYTLLLTLSSAGRRSFDQGTLSYGQVIEQVITDDVPYHNWEFTGQAGQVIDINMRTLSGNLSPALNLISPLNNTLVADDALNQNDEANILAFRLPLDGNYSITTGRTGEINGLAGDTTGTYSLQLTLRNGAEATANTLVPGQTVEGRLTQESPLVRYSVVGERTNIALVELSEPGCLVDLALLDRGGQLQERFVGLTPLAQALNLVPSGRNWTLEISAQQCEHASSVDFVFTLQPIAVEFPLQALPVQQMVSGQAGLTRWFFTASAGDMVRLQVHNPQPDVALPLRVRNSQNTVIYTADYYRAFDETLLLTEGGIYTVEIEGGLLPYQLENQLVGRDNVLFNQQSGIWSQFLDVRAGEIWSITPQITRPAMLVVESPTGDILATAQSGALTPPSLPQLYFPTDGRYTIKIFSEERPSEVQIVERLADDLPVNGTAKGVLSEEITYKLWDLPLRAGDLLDLRLSRSTENVATLALSLLSPAGVKLEPQAIINQSEYIDYAIPLDGVYQVLVGVGAAEQDVTYEIETQVTRSHADTATPDLVINSAVPEFFAAEVTPALDPYLAPVIPDEDALFASARTLVLSETGRGEIAPGQRREVWQINVLQAQMLSITVTSVDGQAAPGITLLDASRNLLSEHWERTSHTNQLLYRVPQSNTYYIAVTGSEAGTRYLLYAETLFDINESVPAVVDILPLQVGQVRSGEFSIQGEVDEYLFWGHTGEQVQITALLQAGNLLPDLTILNAAGLEVGSYLFGENTRQAQSEVITIPDDGFYTIRLTASREGRTDEYSQYQLLVSRISGEQEESGWLNDEVYGFVGFNQPRDNWYFYGTAGEAITLQATPLETTGPSPLILYLADTAGNIFLQRSTLLNINQLTVADVMLPYTGIYRVSVSGGEIGIGNYRLHLTRDQQYLRPGDHALAYGETVAGVMTTGNVFDRWVFAGNQGDVIAIALRSVRGNLPLMGFQLEDAAQNSLALVSDAGNGAGARQELITLPATGMYSILVGSLDNATEGAGVYELSLELQNRTITRQAGTLIPYQVTVNSTLYADDPTDIWLFEGQQDDLVSINVTGDGVVIPTLSLFNASPEIIESQPQPLLVRTGTATEAAQLIQYRLPAGGAYGLVIAGIDNTTGNYTLEVRAEQQVDQIITPLTPAALVEARIEQADVQRWQFTGAAGEQMTLTLTPLRSTGLAPTLTVYSPSQQIVYQHTGASGEIVALENYSLPATGSYTVVVGTAFGAEGSTNGQYALLLEQTSNPQASASQLDDGVGLGTLSQANPDDRWVLAGTAGQVFRIIAERTSGNIDVTLRVLDSTGQVIAASDDTDTSQDAALVLALPQDDTYTLEVSRFGRQLGVTEGNYRVEALPIYQNVTTQPSSERYLSYGQRVVDTLDPLTNGNTLASHIWYFVGQQNDQVSASIQFPGDDLPLTLFIADGAGNRYQQAERVNDQAFLANFTLPADGLYSLIVQRSQDSRVEEFHPYSLALDLDRAEDSIGAGGFLTSNRSATGRLTQTSHTHVWLYRGQAEEIVSIGLATLGNTPLPDVLVLSPNGDVITSLSGTSTTLNQTVQLPVDGLYQIMVVNRTLAPLTVYRLAVNPGAQVELGGVLTPDQSYTGVVMDEQVWLIEGVEGHSVYARLSVQEGSPALILQLETADGQVLGVAEGDPLNGDLLLSAITLPADGEYRLVVSSPEALETASRYLLRISDQPVFREMLLSQYMEPGSLLHGAVDGVQKSYFTLQGDPQVAASIGLNVLDGTGIPALRLLNQQGKTVASYTGRVDHLTFPARGVYLLEVTHPTPLYFDIQYVLRPNTPQGGTEVRELRRDVNLQGTISPETPDALWRFTAGAGETLHFEINTIGVPLPLDLILYDPAGFPVVTQIATDGISNLVFGPVFIGESGDYTLRIGTWLNNTPTAEVRYNMRVSTVTETPASTGGALPFLGQPVFGYLTAADPADNWTIQTPAPETLNITLTRTSGAGELSLTITDKAGNPVDLAPYLSETAGAWLIQGLPVPADSPYQITVNLPEATDLTAYRLLIQVQAAEAAAVPVSNRAYESRPLSVDTPELATFSPFAPVHEWVLAGFSNGNYLLSIEPVSPHWPPQVWLVDPQNQVLAQGEVNSNGDIQLPLTLTPEASYSVLITAPHIAETYSIHLTENLIQTGPAPLTAFAPVQGYLDAANDVDEWVWQGTLAEIIQIVLQGETGTTIRLYAPGYYLLQEWIADENGAVNSEAILLPIEGRYIIQILVPAGSSGERYELTVNRAS